MRKLTTLLLFITLGITLSACDGSTEETLTTPDTTNDSEFIIETTDDTFEVLENEDDDDDDDDYGSTGALQATDYTLEDMLLYAIQDEYAARAEYDYILNTFDVTKPFSNIINSEETHISMLIPLFEAYGIELPEDTAEDHLITIESLEETFAIGVIAEINNIAMYNIFLESEELPEDVYDVFVKLRDASENHLAAFEKNAAKYQ